MVRKKTVKRKAKKRTHPEWARSVTFDLSNDQVKLLKPMIAHANSMLKRNTGSFIIIAQVELLIGDEWKYGPARVRARMYGKDAWQPINAAVIEANRVQDVICGTSKR